VWSRRAGKGGSAREATKVKKLVDLLPAYLEIREKGSADKLWKPLRPKSLEDVVRYLKGAWARRLCVHHIYLQVTDRRLGCQQPTAGDVPLS